MAVAIGSDRIRRARAHIGHQRAVHSAQMADGRWLLYTLLDTSSQQQPAARGCIYIAAMVLGDADAYGRAMPVACSDSARRALYIVIASPRAVHKWRDRGGGRPVSGSDSGRRCCLRALVP